jgi:hypothetical protein
MNNLEASISGPCYIMVDAVSNIDGLIWGDLELL